MPDYTEKVLASSAPIGTPILAVRTDKPATRTTANAQHSFLQVDSAGNLRVSEEGGKATYFATSQFSSDSTATDIAQFLGVAGVTAKIQWVFVNTALTATATGDLSVIRRSTANTAGTTGNASVAQADGGDAAASCQPVHYTAHPTGLGTSAGIIFGIRWIAPALGGGTAGAIPQGVFFDFRQFTGGKGLRVQGTSDFVSINVPAALGGAGNVWDIVWCWTEEPTTA